MARTALSMLMKQAGSNTSQQMASQDAASKAQQLTKVTMSGTSENYSLQADDLLNYAMAALKGGEASLNEALMKAANKIASTIQHKASKLLLFEDIGVPFPEITQRRGK